MPPLFKSTLVGSFSLRMVLQSKHTNQTTLSRQALFSNMDHPLEVSTNSSARFQVPPILPAPLVDLPTLEHMATCIV
jgi:hypothetical protein